MHLTAIAISGALCGAGYVYIFKGLHERLQIWHEINLKLPLDQQFEPTFWTYWTWQKFRQLQTELLPGDVRPQRVRNFQLLGFALLASGALIFLVALKW